MEVTLSWQSIIVAGSVLAALGGIFGYLAKAVRFFDRQKEQDTELKKLAQHHEDDKKALHEEMEHELSTIYEEQTILTYGILACLKGLSEQGCNGPVTEAINKIEKHLNQKAHERK